MQTLNLGIRFCNSSMFNKQQQAIPTKWCKSVNICCQVRPLFHPNLSQRLRGWDTVHQNGAQSIKFQFAPAADVWWVFLPALVQCSLQTCSNEYFRPRDDPHTHTNYSSLGHFLNQRATRGLKAIEIQGCSLGLQYLLQSL